MFVTYYNVDDCYGQEQCLSMLYYPAEFHSTGTDFFQRNHWEGGTNPSHHK